MKTSSYPIAASVALCNFFLLPSVISSSLVLDLSYRSRLNADTLATAVGDIVWKAGEKGRDVVDVDVSSSELGDDGIEKVVGTLLPTEAKVPPDAHPIAVNFSARMNRLSPVGVTSILKAITEMNATSKEENREEKESTTAENDRAAWYLCSLDVGWNDLSPEATGSKTFLSALKNLLASERCPQELRLDQCGLTPASCRSIGKGVMNRFADGKKRAQHKSLSLHLCGNGAVGDAGVAAIAAALRASPLGNKEESSETTTVFDVLDLSSCGVGDAGAEALAMALETHPFCIRQLDLSNNCISDEGAAVLAGALSKADKPKGGSAFSLESLDLSNNKDIGDRGATELAEAIELGNLMTVSLRSCHVRADGAKAFGRALQGISPFSDNIKTADYARKVDLSGNPLGILRGKTKSDGKYSATKLKSKASATASSYMSIIGKNIRSGLKDVGFDVGRQSAESDDDEEERMGIDAEADVDASKARCGAKSFASEVIQVGEELQKKKLPQGDKKRGPIRCELAMRHCFLDTGGADGLAAAVMEAKERLGVILDVDVGMNNVLESEMVAALKGDDNHHSTLEAMAERYLEAMESLRVAEERAAEAAAAATSRVMGPPDEWGDDEKNGMFGLDQYDNDYDSDAIYDDDDDNYDY